MKNKFKTLREKIEVMEAFERGEQIEVKFLNNDGYSFDDDDYIWKEIKNPNWNWDEFDYRVKQKPKTKFVPFETVEEFLEAQKNHGQIVVNDDPNDYYNIYYSYVNNVGDLVLVANWNYCKQMSLEKLFNEYVFKDNTPCGKEVEE